MWERGKDGSGQQRETSGVNKDKTESILTAVEAPQSTLSWCLPQPPCTHWWRVCHAEQAEPSCPTHSRKHIQTSEMQMLGTGQPHRESGLPVCVGTSSKLAQKIMWTLAERPFQKLPNNFSLLYEIPQTIECWHNWQKILLISLSRDNKPSKKSN